METILKQNDFMTFLKNKKDPELKQKDGIIIRIKTSNLDVSDLPVNQLDENTREVLIKQLII